MAKRIRISNEKVNCYGTWVKTDGVSLEQFQKNPVLLWMHWRGYIIGCIKDVKVEGEVSVSINGIGNVAVIMYLDSNGSWVVTTARVENGSVIFSLPYPTTVVILSV